MIYYAAVSMSRKEGVNINLGLPPVPSRSAQFSFVSVFVNSFVKLKLRKCALQTALLRFVLGECVSNKLYCIHLVEKQQGSCTYVLTGINCKLMIS